MFGYQKIVEKKIREAIEKGELKNLPGEGKPLILEDDSRVPEDLRLAYKVLKNANCLPEEIELKKEILNMEEMLGKLTEEKDKYHLIKKINFNIMKLNSIGNKSLLLEENQIYYNKIVDKMDNK